VTGTVNAKSVRAALGAARALGLDAAGLAAAHGLAEAIDDVDARCPHASWLALWQDIARRTGREAIGIEAAERLPSGHWDVIHYLIATADDLRGALRRFDRYFGLVSTGVAHVFEEDRDGARLVRRYAPDCQTRLLAPAEFAFAALVTNTRAALATRWTPREVHFAAPAPTSDAPHRRLFGCPIVFDAAVSALWLTPESLALRMPRPDPELGRILTRHADVMIAQLGTESDIVARLRRIIVDALPDADVTVGVAARKLGMSVRTLQRRLQDGGLSFDDVYDGTRKELARRYLGDPALSIQETAHLLAFGDLRGFYRAFRRWEGCTPAAFRRRGAGDDRRAGAPGP